MTVSPPPTDTDRLAEALDLMPFAYMSPRALAAALAPVVEQIAARHAAEFMRWAAAEVRAQHGTASLAAKHIEAAAAALVAAHPDQGQQR